MLRSLARSTGVHIAFAFLAMGGWGLFANWGHGGTTWAAALGQGVLSGLITLVLKRALEAMAPRFAGAAAYVAPPLITALAILAVLAGAHRLIGSPELWRTIAVPWSVSTLYAILYAASLARRGAQAT